MTTEWADYGEQDYGELDYGEGRAWGARENGNPADETSPLVQIPPGMLNAVQSCTDRIYKQLSGAQSWVDMMTAIGELFGDLDQVLAAVDWGRYRWTARGKQLDLLGELVNRPRGSLVDDDDYRLAILVDVATMFASGTGPEIIELAHALTERTPELQAFWPGAWRLRLPDLSGALFDLLISIMGDVPAAGVAALLSTYSTEGSGGWASPRATLPSTDEAADGLLWAPDLLTLHDPISGLTGTATGTTYVPEVVGRNFTGPGSTQQIEWASPEDLSGATWSFAAWVRVNQTTTRNRFVTISNGVAQQAFFQTHPGGDLEFNVLHATASLSIITTETLTIGQWHHVAVTYDGGTATSGVHMYIDGVEANIAFATAGAGAQNPLSGPWLLGARVVNDTVNLDGQIAQPRVWDRVLSADEIYHLYLEGLDDDGNFAGADVADSGVQPAAGWSSHYGGAADVRSHWATARKMGLT